MSERVMRARAMFGARARAPWGWCAAEAAARLRGALGAGEVALVTGPSGSGKSTIGRLLGAAPAEPPAGARVLDLFACGMEPAMALLARAGLGEARVMLARVRELSEGERARLRIALAMEVGWEVVVLDEFASVLDRRTGAALCRTVQRWARETGARVVCITAHEDVMAWLGPRVLAVVGRAGVRIERR